MSYSIQTIEGESETSDFDTRFSKWLGSWMGGEGLSRRAFAKLCGLNYSKRGC